jgi:hypothetical protein
MAITYDQAIKFRDSPIGSQIPFVSDYLRPSNWNNLNNDLKTLYLSKIEAAINDSIGTVTKALSDDAQKYSLYANLSNGGATAQAEAEDAKKRVEKDISFLFSQKLPIEKIQEAVTSGLSSGTALAQEDAKRKSSSSFLDKLVDIASVVGVGALTSGLGSAIALS